MRTALDFRNSNGDTDYPEVDAILPITDGEAASQTVFRRPIENVRNRSEVLREYVQEHMLLQEMMPILYCGIPGATGWEFQGAAPGFAGTFTTTTDIVIAGMATAGGLLLYPHIVSMQATLPVGTPSSNQLIFTSIKKQWEGSAFPAADANGIAVEIVAGASLTVTTKGAAGNLNHIYITIVSGTTTCDQLIAAVTASSPANTLVTVVLGAGSTGTNPAPLWGPPQWSGDYSQRFLTGGSAGVVHTISPSTLATFFAAHVDNLIQEGDTIGVWYNKSVDKTSTGGRLQSTYENGNYAIPAGSLFNSRREPWKLPNSVPICKCVNSTSLLFADGSYLQYGVPAALGSIDSLFMTNVYRGLVYASGWGWTCLDTGTYSPPANVKETFDNIDLKLGTNIAEVVAARNSSVFGAKASLDARIEAVDTHARSFVSVTDGSTSTGGMYNGVTALQDAFTALASAQGGTIFVQGGSYDITAQVTTTWPIRIIGVSGTVNVSCKNAANHAFRFNSGARGSRIENVNLANGPGGNGQMAYVGDADITFDRVYGEGQFMIRGSDCRFGDCELLGSGMIIDGNSASCLRLHIQDSRLTGTSTGAQMLYFSSGAQCVLDNILLTVPDNNVGINTAPGCRISLLNSKIMCSPFTASQWVLSFEGGFHRIDNVEWTVVGTGDISTGLINMQADEFTGTNLFFNMGNNRLNYGAYNNPIMILGTNCEIDGLVVINAGRIPTFGEDGFVVNGDTPYIALTGWDGQLTLRNAHISGFSVSGTASLGIDLTVTGDHGSSGKYTYEGRTNLENVYVDVASVNYWTSGNGIVIFRCIQPNSTYRGCTVDLGATGLIGIVWNVLHTVNVIIDGNTVRSTFGAVLKYVLAMYGGTSTLRNCAFTNNTCSVWTVYTGGFFVWIDAMTSTESHTINNNRLILEPGTGTETMVQLGTGTYYCTVMGNVIHKGSGFGIVDNGTGNLSAGLNVIW